MLKRLFSSVSAAIADVANPTPAAPGAGQYAELLDPIEGSTGPAGIDLAYEDEYAAIQDEIAKRGDIDDSVIQGNAIHLLRTRGKDLRAAVFLAYSTLRVDGLQTSLQALGLVCALIETFGADVHPRKPAARRAALEWLCNERFIDPLALKAKESAESRLQELEATVSALAASTESWPEEARPDLSGLSQRIALWLGERSTQELRLAVSNNAQPEPALPALTSAPAGSDLASVTPKSAQDAWLLIRKASLPLRADPQWAEAGRALTRAARWASIAQMPPHQGGMTRFAAPRKEARAYLLNLQANAQWHALIDECARVFNEASNHLWLDLVHWSELASQHLASDHELPSAQLTLDVRTLLQRLPQLVDLKFDDGSAFAAPDTHEWLKNLLKPHGSVPGRQKAAPAEAEGSNPEVFDRAKAAVRAQGVAAGLGVLQAAAQSCRSQHQRFALQGQMLDLARDAGRRDLALGLARNRAFQVEEFSLDRWAPELAFDVWAELYALLRASGEPGQAEARTLYGRLCGLDAMRAADLQ